MFNGGANPFAVLSESNSSSSEAREVEGEEVDVDWLRLVKPNHDVHVKVSEKISLDGLPEECSLLAVANGKGLLFAGSNVDVKVYRLTDLHGALERSKETKTLEHTQVIQLPERPIWIRLAMNEERLIVATPNHICLYKLNEVISGNTTPYHTFPSSNLLDILPNPATTDLSRYVTLLSRDGFIIADIEGCQLSNPLAGDFTCSSWSARGKQLVVGTLSGLIQYTPEGVEKARIPSPNSTHYPTHIQWLENDLFLVAYAEKNAQPDDALDIYLVQRQGQAFSYTKFYDVNDTMGHGGRSSLFRRFVGLRNWGKSKHLDLVVSGRSSAIGVLHSGEKWEALIVDETARGVLPAAKGGLDDTTCLGFELDLTSETIIKRGIVGGIELPDIPPAPRVLVYSQEGEIIVFDIQNSDAESYPGMVVNGQSTAQTSTPAKPSAPASGFGQSAFGSTQSSSPFGTAKTPSAFGTPATTVGFGQPAFGKPAAPTAFGQTTPAKTTTAFGQSAFGSTTPTTTPSSTPSAFAATSITPAASGQSAFGKPVASPAFGAPSTTSAFGKPAFGAPAAPTAFGAPAFGAPAFGQPAAPKAAFGSSPSPSVGFGAFSSTASKPAVGFGFGTSTPGGASSGFGAFGKSAESKPSAFAGFGSTAPASTPAPATSSAFGSSAFGKPSTSGSAFGSSRLVTSTTTEVTGSATPAVSSSPAASPRPANDGGFGLSNFADALSPVDAPVPIFQTPNPSSPPGSPIFFDPKRPAGLESPENSPPSVPPLNLPTISASKSASFIKPPKAFAAPTGFGAFGQGAAASQPVPAFGSATPSALSSTPAATPAKPASGFGQVSFGQSTLPGFGQSATPAFGQTSKPTTSIGNISGGFGGFAKPTTGDKPSAFSSFSSGPSVFGSPSAKPSPFGTGQKSDTGDKPSAFSAFSGPSVFGASGSTSIFNSGDKSANPTPASDKGSPQSALEPGKEAPAKVEVTTPPSQPKTPSSVTPVATPSQEVPGPSSSDIEAFNNLTKDGVEESLDSISQSTVADTSVKNETEESVSNDVKAGSTDDKNDELTHVDREDAKPAVAEDERDGAEDRVDDGYDTDEYDEDYESEEEYGDEEVEGEEGDEEDDHRIRSRRSFSSVPDLPTVTEEGEEDGQSTASDESAEEPLTITTKAPKSPPWFAKKASSPVLPPAPTTAEGSSEPSLLSRLSPEATIKPSLKHAARTSSPLSTQPVFTATESTTPPGTPSKPVAAVQPAPVVAAAQPQTSLFGNSAKDPARSLFNAAAPVAPSAPTASIPGFSFGSDTKSKPDTDPKKPAGSLFGNFALPSQTGVSSAAPIKLDPAPLFGAKSADAPTPPSGVKPSPFGLGLGKPPAPATVPPGVTQPTKGFSFPSQTPSPFTLSGSTLPTTPAITSEPAKKPNAWPAFNLSSTNNTALGKPAAGSTSLPAAETEVASSKGLPPSSIPPPIVQSFIPPVRSAPSLAPPVNVQGTTMAAVLERTIKEVERDLANLRIIISHQSTFHASHNSQASVTSTSLKSLKALPLSALPDVEKVIVDLSQGINDLRKLESAVDIKVGEVQSNMLKTDMKIGQAEKFLKARKDPSFARAMQIRELSPQQAASQVRLRKLVQTTESRLDELDASISSLKKSAERRESGKSNQQPALERVQKSVRNVDAAIRDRQQAIDELSKRISTIRLSTPTKSTPRSAAPRSAIGAAGTPVSKEKEKIDLEPSTDISDRVEAALEARLRFRLPSSVRVTKSTKSGKVVMIDAIPLPGRVSTIPKTTTEPSAQEVSPATTTTTIPTPTPFGGMSFSLDAGNITSTHSRSRTQTGNRNHTPAVKLTSPGSVGAGAGAGAGSSKPAGGFSFDPPPTSDDNSTPARKPLFSFAGFGK